MSNSSFGLTENIGFIGSDELCQELASHFVDLPYLFENHSDITALEKWVETHRPKLIIIEAQTIKTTQEKEKLQNFNQTLTRLGTLSLVLTRTLEDIKRWQNLNWFRIQFYHGALSLNSLRRKIIDLLNEHLFIENPLTVILSDNASLRENLMILIRNYGIRARGYALSGTKERFSLSADELPDIIIYEGVTEEEIVKNYLSQVKWSDHVFFVRLSEKWPPDGMSIDEAKENNVFKADNSSEILSHILSRLYERRNVKFKVCRNEATGIYLSEIFFDLTQRQIHIAKEYNETFSVLKARLDQTDPLTEQKGPSFVSQVCHNLGNFIKNRVRASDVVAESGNDSILILLPQIDKEELEIVTNRIQEKMTDVMGESSDIQPKFLFDTYSYPDDFGSLEDIKSKLEL